LVDRDLSQFSIYTIKSFYISSEAAPWFP